MISDLALGLRLALRGGQSGALSFLRLAMTAVGIGLAVTTLLVAASMNTMLDKRVERAAASVPLTKEDMPRSRQQLDPLYLYSDTLETSNGKELGLEVVAATGKSSPIPPGLSRLPRAGELFVSPALAKALQEPSNEALRAQVPGKLMGIIDKPGIVDPADFKAYVGGKTEQLAAEKGVIKVYGFGASSHDLGIPPFLIPLLVPIAAALLVPLLIFVTTSSRIGFAQRERRLAMLRLIGIDVRRIRQIAAAETLLGAGAGLALGAGLFFATRPLLGKVDFLGFTVFSEDLVPSWPLVLLIALLVPLLAVAVALIGLRRTVIEPLGVVRQREPTRRRLAWRWVIVGLGVVILATTRASNDDGNNAIPQFIGIALLLLGIAAVLPAAVEQLVSRLRGGSPSWQLAIRRLQLDSGSASRVVSGLVAVLAVMVFVQIVIASLDREAQAAQPQDEKQNFMHILTSSPYQEEALDRVRVGKNVQEAYAIRQSSLVTTGETATSASVEIGDCAALVKHAKVKACRDGDVFFTEGPSSSSHLRQEDFAGKQIRFQEYDEKGNKKSVGPEWTLPHDIRHVRAYPNDYVATADLLITPAALDKAVIPDSLVWIYAKGNGNNEELFTTLAKAVAPFSWHATIYPHGNLPTENSQSERAQLRTVLLFISVFVLIVAGLNLLVLTVEQLIERRRALAAQSAAGVPVSVLARSTLWQNAIPMALGVLLALAAGLGLAVFTLNRGDIPISIDGWAISGLVALAAFAVLVVTSISLPLLRQVTRLESLRTE